MSRVMRPNRDGFTSFEREAAISCLRNNAVKIGNVLSPESVWALRQGVPKVPSLLVHDNKAPELKGFFDLFDDVDIDTPGLVRIGDVIEIPKYNGKAVPHIDRGVRSGLSILIPIDGEDACFSADDEYFAGDVYPGYVETYGLGDVMLLRQPIETVDGETVNLSASWHMGLSPAIRKVVTVDYEQPNLRFVD